MEGHEGAVRIRRAGALEGLDAQCGASHDLLLHLIEEVVVGTAPVRSGHQPREPWAVRVTDQVVVLLQGLPETRSALVGQDEHHRTVRDAPSLEMRLDARRDREPLPAPVAAPHVHRGEPAFATRRQRLDHRPGELPHPRRGTEVDADGMPIRRGDVQPVEGVLDAADHQPMDLRTGWHAFSRVQRQRWRRQGPVQRAVRKGERMLPPVRVHQPALSEVHVRVPAPFAVHSEVVPW